MNPKDYAQKAVTIDQLDFHPEVDVSESATVAFRFGYPIPKTGVSLFSGPRGRVNAGIDAPADQLRNGIAELIVSVAEDCISVASGILSDEDQVRITKAIRNRFEIRLN